MTENEGTAQSPSPTILDENVGAQFIEPVSAGSMNRTPTGQVVGAALRGRLTLFCYSYFS